MIPADQRLKSEIEHGKYLLKHGAGEIWNWETPAGRERWKRRVDYLCSNISPQDNVLEIGCGTGFFTRELQKTNAEITAIDISPELLDEAKKNVKAVNVAFKVENAYDLTFPDNSFEVILGSSVLHHLDIDKALKQFYRVLKENGRILFTEPNMLNPHVALLKNIPYLKRKMGESPNETAFFRWRLKEKFLWHGFNQVSIKPFDFLHPQTPKAMIQFMKKTSFFLEKTPILSEIAGSLLIKATKR